MSGRSNSDDLAVVNSELLFRAINDDISIPWGGEGLDEPQTEAFPK
jgi:hypothetical protein